MSDTSPVPSGDRRTAIADAAIAVLATGGSRGLTHRAIDRELALPEGSTSAYLRTRAGLFIAATHRLAELDRAALDALNTRLLAAGADLTPPQVIAAIVDDWTSPRAAPRQLARIELQLQAARDAAVAEVLATQRLAFIGLTRAMLETWQVADPAQDATASDAVARLLTVLVDGLIADRLLHDRTAVPAEHLGEALAHLVASLAAPAGRGARLTTRGRGRG